MVHLLWAMHVVRRSAESRTEKVTLFVLIKLDLSNRCIQLRGFANLVNSIHPLLSHNKQQSTTSVYRTFHASSPGLGGHGGGVYSLSSKVWIGKVFTLCL